LEFGDDYILCMIIKGCTVQFHLSRSEVVHAGLSIVKENCKWLIYKFVFSFSQFLNLLQEQIEWAVEENADFIIGETFNDFGEAMLALKLFSWQNVFDQILR
jgi:methionine synthase I (cobalamin-dependent)